MSGLILTQLTVSQSHPLLIRSKSEEWTNNDSSAGWAELLQEHLKKLCCRLQRWSNIQAKV